MQREKKMIQTNCDDDDDDEKTIEGSDFTCSFYCSSTTISFRNYFTLICLYEDKNNNIYTHTHTHA